MIGLCKMMKNVDWIFLDLETTGLDPQNDKIIEIAAVTRFADGRREEYQQLINPGITVPSAITRLTGIEDSMLVEAPSFKEIASKLEEMLLGKVIVAHNASFDLGFLEAAFGKSLDNKVIDTVELARIVSFNQASYNLRYLCHCFSLEGEPSHRALDDTIALEKLFFYLLDLAREIPLSVLQEISYFLGQEENGLNLLFNELATEKISQFDFSQNTSYPTVEEAETTTEASEVHWDIKSLEEAFMPGSSIAKGLGVYQKRTQQIKMMKAVAKAFQQERHLIVEAGTGVGKTLAYLVPALNWSLSQSEKVVVSTHTIALQEQILQSDIKFLQKNLGFAFKAAVLKGRGNYLCLHKWKTAKDNADSLTWFERVALARMVHWLAKDQNGDKDTIHLRNWENEFFGQFACNRETCGGNDCPYIKECFYQKARQKAQYADLIIVNHSLLLADLLLGEAILPKFQYLIVDEAHHLEEEGTRQFSASYSLRETQRRMQQISRKRDILNKSGILPYWKKQLPALLGKDNPQVSEALNIIKDSANKVSGLQHLIDDIFHYVKNINIETLRLKEEIRQQRWWENLSILFNNLSLGTMELLDNLRRLYRILTVELELQESDNPLRQLKQVLTELEREKEFLANYFTPELKEDQVYWLENEHKRPDLRLYITPLNTGPIFEELLFSQKTSAVLTSATLSVNNSFTYLLEQLGIPEDSVDVLQIQSPFLYDEQVSLLVDTSLPEPSGVNEDIYTSAVQEALLTLIKATRGGTLVLFTSRKQLKQVYEGLSQSVQEMGFELFADGINGNRINLVNELKDNPKAIVFGTNTFWEGIDLPGKSLTAVIMIRLPFNPPNNPLVEARLEELNKEGKNGFYSYSLPQAILRFRQGYGRLIRTMDDCGVVIILDNRLVNKRYGKLFIRSLPSQKYSTGSTSVIAQRVQEWFKELNIK